MKSLVLALCLFVQDPTEAPPVPGDVPTRPLPPNTYPITNLGNILGSMGLPPSQVQEAIQQAFGPAAGSGSAARTARRRVLQLVGVQVTFRIVATLVAARDDSGYSLDVAPYSLSVQYGELLEWVLESVRLPNPPRGMRALLAIAQINNRLLKDLLDSLGDDGGDDSTKR